MIQSISLLYWMINEAMEKEINILSNNKTWDLVEKPNKNIEVLDLRCVFTKQSGNRKKEDLYLLVARIQKLKLFLSYYGQNKLRIFKLDVETDFLNGRVKSEVFVEQLQGYADNTGKRCKLKKALYGLK